jgi:putative transposase
VAHCDAGSGSHPLHQWRLNGSLRHEWLDLSIFETIDAVQQIATERLWTCNNERPNMGIGGVTPAMTLKMAA